MSTPNTMKIDANFDVDQVSPTLECHFKRSNPTDKKRAGKNAGSVVFEQGDEVFLQVNAGGDMLDGGALPFKSFKIIDCTITTRPRVYRCGPNEKKTVYAPPSPFRSLVGAPAKGATVVLPASEFTEITFVPTPEYFKIGQLWNGKLTVGQVKARWRMTLMVTVMIEFEHSEPEMRVYEIDPETEVETGSGGHPPGEGDPEQVAMAMCASDPETEVETGSGGGSRRT